MADRAPAGALLWGGAGRRFALAGACRFWLIINWLPGHFIVSAGALPLFGPCVGKPSPPLALYILAYQENYAPINNILIANELISKKKANHPFSYCFGHPHCGDQRDYRFRNTGSAVPSGRMFSGYSFFSAAPSPPPAP